MISRRITPKQPGRRYLTAFAVIGLLGGTLLGGAVANATTPAGLFELEGNAITENTAPGSDDWDRVCHEVTITRDTTSSITDQCASATDTTTATAVAWTTDTHAALGALGACSGNNCTIFTGGGSKDPIDINQWAWKDNVGGLPDKDNLQHGFAARYSIPSSPTCPGPNNNQDGTTKCEMLFFGNDRFDNSGDAQQGFWFFQNKIGLGTNAVGGGNGFTSSNAPQFHRNGDLLLISDFSNGGTVSTITVYTWDTACLKNDISPKTGPINGVSCGDANLRFQASSNQANCDGGGGVDPAISGFCGVVNLTDGVPSPWAFVDKTTISPTHPANTFLTNEFYEGGVNLGFLGLQSECFASVASETRSSQSTTATLKDFVLGSFGSCEATLATQVSNSSVTPGTAVHDTATVTGTNPNVTPTGNVTFFLCSFAAGSTDVCDGTTGHVGTQVGSPVALSGSGAIATAQSDDVNTQAASLLPGHYCFRAEWPGDSNYIGAKTEFSGATECFDVSKLPSQTATTSNPNTNNVAPGTSVTDTATVSGSGPTPTGSVTFFLCQPSEVTSGGCEGTAGTQIGSAKPLSGGQATSDATTNTTTLGKYCWRAEYGGDTVYEPSSHTDATGECFTVTNSASGTSDQTWLPNDHVDITTPTGTLSGTLAITLRSGSCTGTVVYTEPVPNSGAFTAPGTYDTTNSTFTVEEADSGTYFWRIVFTPTDTVNATGFTTCESTVITVDDTP